RGRRDGLQPSCLLRRTVGRDDHDLCRPAALLQHAARVHLGDHPDSIHRLLQPRLAQRLPAQERPGDHRGQLEHVLQAGRLQRAIRPVGAGDVEELGSGRSGAGGYPGPRRSPAVDYDAHCHGAGWTDHGREIGDRRSAEGLARVLKLTASRRRDIKSRIRDYAIPRLRVDGMLTVNNIEVIYWGSILVLKGVSLSVGEGTITALIGANGAGKTTTLKAITGLVRLERGEVTRGTIEYAGRRIEHKLPEETARAGIVMVREGRRLFEDLTAEENLLA